MSNKSKIISAVVILIVIIGAIFFGVAVNNKSKEKVNLEEIEVKESNLNATAEIKEDNDDNIPKMELTREASLEATTNLLKVLNKSPEEGLTLEDRLKEVSKENYDKNKVFTPEGWKLLNLSDFMKTDPRGEVLIAQSMLSILNAIEESGNKEIKSANVPLDGVIYFDEEMKISFIPVDLYTNAPTKLSFEMVYVDGDWLLQPYTIISQIAIRTTEQGLINKTPEGKKVLSDEASKDDSSETKSSSEESKEDNEEEKDSTVKNEDNKNEDNKNKDNNKDKEEDSNKTKDTKDK